MEPMESNTSMRESIEALFQSVENYISQHFLHNQQKNDFVVMDAKRWKEEKRVHHHTELNPQATQPTPTPKAKNREHDPFDDILSLFRSAPCPQQDLEDLLNATDAGFSETLLLLIDRAGKKDSEIYKRANVDRKLFSKIRSNKNYRPSKTTALAFAVALELDLPSTQDLIGRAGYTLTHSSKLDIIVEYFIVNKRYDIDEINITLHYFDQPCLGL